MFSKATTLALFSLAISTVSVHAAPAKGVSFETETFCNTATIAISTVVQTQTKTVEVTKYLTKTSASGSQSTGSSSNNSGSKGSSNSGSKGSSGSEGSSGSKGGSKGSSTTASSSGGLVTSSISVPGSSATGLPSGNNAATAGGDGPSAAAIALQTSLELDQSVICTNFADDGQTPPVAGQTASKTTTNNWINFCALTLPNTPMTNGLQISTGSCNPTPLGLIPSTDNMPSAKFSFPKNMGFVQANTPFNVSMKISGMQAGSFTNAQKTYFGAPQQLNKGGQIIGHAHFVIEAITSLDQTDANDPQKFVFFKGINDAGVDNVLSTPVSLGLPAGAYRVCSINTSANHSPIIGPVAQHGSFDDCSYFTAVEGAVTSSASESQTASTTESASASASESASSESSSESVPASTTDSAGTTSAAQTDSASLPASTIDVSSTDSGASASVTSASDASTSDAGASTSTSDSATSTDSGAKGGKGGNRGGKGGKQTFTPQPASARPATPSTSSAVDSSSTAAPAAPAKGNKGGKGKQTFTPEPASASPASPASTDAPANDAEPASAQPASAQPASAEPVAAVGGDSATPAQASKGKRRFFRS